MCFMFLIDSSQRSFITALRKYKDFNTLWLRPWVEVNSESFKAQSVSNPIPRYHVRHIATWGFHCSMPWLVWESWDLDSVCNLGISAIADKFSNLFWTNIEMSCSNTSWCRVSAFPRFPAFGINRNLEIPGPTRPCCVTFVIKLLWISAPTHWRCDNPSQLHEVSDPTKYPELPFGCLCLFHAFLVGNLVKSVLWKMLWNGSANFVLLGALPLGWSD